MRSVCVVFLGILIYWGWFFYNHFEVGREVPLTKQPCQTVRGPLGTEDLLKWRGVVLTTNLDALSLWTWPSETDPSVSDPTSAQPGRIWALRGIETGSPSLEALDMVDFPEGVAFHPHGFGLWSQGDLLFVVNHAYALGGERVDVFKLVEENGKITLFYQSSVRFSKELSGVMNDVVPVSKDEFYISKWLVFPDTEEGRPTSLLHKIANLVPILIPLQPKLTDIYYCKSASGKSEDVCKIVGPKGTLWNGLTSLPDGSIVYAYDLMINTIFAFAKGQDGELKEIRKYRLPHYGDDIYYDEEDGKIWYGGMTSLWKGFLKWSHDYETSPRVAVPGGPSPSGLKSPGHVSSVDLQTGEVVTYLSHDGSLLGLISSGLRYGKYVIAGSYMDNGLLICEMPKQ
eukprot:TRINITY_DN5800_c0_g1_i1.p1 TRINITY_DN5800_c0_g1~~TRINITY_DN5800_c0_g1_i1.p1  ORF type:complete len:399 (+),score=60.54 TRINITY_DN5800_c0_g1_i1:14-1210(+)